MFQPYVESPSRFVVISASMSNSINTSEVDPYRQGVEITDDKFLYIGSTAKIHAGEPNHQLPQQQFGNTRQGIFQDLTRYVEVDKFVPVNFVKAQATSTYASITYPTVLQTTIQPRNIFDGIIEPLAIRDVIQGQLPKSIFTTHAIRANIESGNNDNLVNSDRVVDLVQFNELNRGIDFYRDNLVTQSNVSVRDLTTNNTTKTRSPYYDSQIKSGLIFEASRSLELVNSLTLSSSNSTLDTCPIVNNYVPANYKSFPKGFNWINTNGLGADSLAFGDLSYKRSSTAWNPSFLNNLVLWLSSTRVQQNTGSITKLIDLSLGHNDAFSSGSSNPTYAAGPPSTITYDGTNDVSICNNALGATGSLTVGILYKLNSVPNNGTAAPHVVTLKTNTSEFFDFFITPSSGWAGYTRLGWLARNTTSVVSSVGISPANALDLNYHTLIVTYNNGNITSSLSYRAFWDGVEQTVSSVAGLDNVTANQTGSVGSYHPKVATTEFFNGAIKEVVMFDGILTGRDFINFNAWLNSTAVRSGS